MPRAVNMYEQYDEASLTPRRTAYVLKRLQQRADQCTSEFYPVVPLFKDENYVHPDIIQSIVGPLIDIKISSDRICNLLDNSPTKRMTELLSVDSEKRGFKQLVKVIGLVFDEICFFSSKSTTIDPAKHGYAKNWTESDWERLNLGDVVQLGAATNALRANLWMIPLLKPLEAIGKKYQVSFAAAELVVDKLVASGRVGPLNSTKYGGLPRHRHVRERYKEEVRDIYRWDIEVKFDTQWRKVAKWWEEARGKITLPSAESGLDYDLDRWHEAVRLFLKLVAREVHPSQVSVTMLETVEEEARESHSFYF